MCKYKCACALCVVSKLPLFGVVCICMGLVYHLGFDADTPKWDYFVHRSTVILCKSNANSEMMALILHLCAAAKHDFGRSWQFAMQNIQRTSIDALYLHTQACPDWHTAECVGKETATSHMCASNVNRTANGFGWKFYFWLFLFNENCLKRNAPDVSCPMLCLRLLSRCELWTRFGLNATLTVNDSIVSDVYFDFQMKHSMLTAQSEEPSPEIIFWFIVDPLESIVYRCERVLQTC